MEIGVRLSDKDRAAFGCDEWLTVDPYAMSFRETVILQKGVEIEGQVISYDSANAWRTAFDGVAGPDGTRVREPAAEGVLVWLALNRAGVKVALADLDYNSDGLGMRIISDPADVGEPGKDPSTQETTSP